MTPACSTSQSATFTHSRLGRSLISRDIEGTAAILARLDWLGDAGDRRVVGPQFGRPADPWRTAAVPELARLGLLRYRRAGTGTAEVLRAGDVLVPATVTEDTEVTVVGEDRDGDPAGPGVHVIRPNPANLNSWFLAGFLLSPGALRRATGTPSTCVSLRHRCSRSRIRNPMPGRSATSVLLSRSLVTSRTGQGH
jgi:hypothetical protein